MVASGAYDPLLLHPSLYPLRWPDLPLVPLLAMAAGLLTAFVAPRPVRAVVRPQPVPVRREEVAA